MSKTERDLQEFIGRARVAGKSTNDIEQSLRQAGWPNDVITKALHIGDDLVPPSPIARSSGRDIFFYLLMFLTLAIAAIGLGGILFGLINRYAPADVVASARYYNPSNLIQSLAAVLVSAPVYFFVMWKLQRDMRSGLTHPQSRVRKVLTYLAVFIASAVIIGDVITVVFNFLNGQLNTKFVLKVLVILLIGGWIIWYYWLNLKHDEARASELPDQPKVWWKHGHALAFVIVFVVALVAGFALGGSPWQRQKTVRDESRVSQLQELQQRIQDYYYQHNELPKSLADLPAGYGVKVPTDPVTGREYEYLPGQGRNLQLCATFELDSFALDAYGYAQSLPVTAYGTDWSHPAGRYCMPLQVMPSPVKS